MTFTEGDPIKLTSSESPLFGETTDCESGQYLWPHPKLDGWHVIEIKDKQGLIDWVNLHESEFEGES